MVDIQLISDMHLEFNDSPKLQDFIIPSAAYLVIVGDLGLPYLDSYRDFLAQCS